MAVYGSTPFFITIRLFQRCYGEVNEAAAMEIDDPNSNICDQDQPQVLNQRSVFLCFFIEF
ncbi:hypothetical protein V6Z11_A06G232200 [Gossypium hirsutum]|uniref:Uncharacterized protein n=1 Tax=Gossypium tomentosum TaxID=34277 RepID=A0A5D2Q8B3_GOSTO|nr:hypothetical protein ES332_A06G234000v1 [Gossypium tomentosum]